MLMRIFTPKEFETIINSVSNEKEAIELSEFVLVNAVAIIDKYGKNHYNNLAYNLLQKIRPLQNLKI